MEVDLGTVRELDARWQALFPGLLVVARRLSRSEADALDLLQDAYAAVRSGQRVWDRDKVPDLFTFLCRALGSSANARAKRASTRLERGFAEDAEEPPSSAPNPEQLALMMEEHAQKREAFRVFREQFARDEIALKVLDFLREGVSEPADQASRLGVPVATIYRAQRRIAYRLEQSPRGPS
jgi:DNA-directed RNA polymerase specialized sigma24 family protein